MTRPTVILADDHVIIADALRKLLQDDVEIVATVHNAEALLEATRRLRPDVVVTDISMPGGMSGLEYLRRIKNDEPRTRVIVLSMFSDVALVSAAFVHGARGYVPKHAAGEELRAAIASVMRGEVYLSPLVAPRVPMSIRSEPGSRPVVLTQRQRDVLTRIVAGKRMKEIAAELHLSRRTVEMHKYRMMRMLGVRSTAELIQYFLKQDAGELMPR